MRLDLALPWREEFNSSTISKEEPDGWHKVNKITEIQFGVSISTINDQYSVFFRKIQMVKVLQATFNSDEYLATDSSFSIPSIDKVSWKRLTIHNRVFEPCLTNTSYIIIPSVNLNCCSRVILQTFEATESSPRDTKARFFEFRCRTLTPFRNKLLTRARVRWYIHENRNVNVLVGFYGNWYVVIIIEKWTILVKSRVAKARNMSIGEHRHCCVTFEL